MEVWLAVSGLLALLGGGAGALAYYRTHYGAGSSSSGGNGNGSGGGSADNFTPYDLGPTTSIPNDPTTIEGIADTITGTTFVDTSAGAVETVRNGTVVDTNAGIVSPIPVGIGRAYVKPSGNDPVDTLTASAVPVPDPSYTGGGINSTQKIVAKPGAPAGAPISIGTPGGVVPTNYGVVVKK